MILYVRPSYALAEGYGVVCWRFINLINLQCALLIHSANHSMV